MEPLPLLEAFFNWFWISFTRESAYIWPSYILWERSELEVSLAIIETSLLLESRKLSKLCFSHSSIFEEKVFYNPLGVKFTQD
jgi:hypothetical protein